MSLNEATGLATTVINHLTPIIDPGPEDICTTITTTTAFTITPEASGLNIPTVTFRVAPVHGSKTMISITGVDKKRVKMERIKQPEFPGYERFDNRLKTFETWPQSSTQAPTRLAEAGFYYTQKHDQTICYCCGGGLKDWQLGDDPWEEHARWFPKCQYLHTVKGASFIKHLNDQGPPLPEKNYPTDKPTEGSLPDRFLCRLCCDHEIDTILLPCGHVVCCRGCSELLNKCCVCRKTISTRVRAYFS